MSKEIGKMKKILIVSTVSRQFYLFEQGNIEVLRASGYEIHGAANFLDENKRLDALGIIKHHFDIQRSPFSLKNIKAYSQLKRIMQSENFDIVHCHSPMGGVLARLAANAVGVHPVIYTAHGFHFYKGAPIINWLLFYPTERFLARFTDVLITINMEDYEQAQKFKAKKVIYVPGIGVDSEKFQSPIANHKLKEELGILENTVVLLSIGEMIKRKNYESVLKSISRIKNEKFVYLVCGQGILERKLRDLSVNLGIEDKVIFLGFRNDIPEICKIADIFILTSYQEGLPVAVMEAMSAGLPVICSAIRGNVDLIKNEDGGFVNNPEDYKGISESIDRLINDKELRKSMGLRNLNEIKKYNKEIVKLKMQEVYKSF